VEEYAGKLIENARRLNVIEFKMSKIKSKIIEVCEATFSLPENSLKIKD